MVAKLARTLSPSPPLPALVVHQEVLPSHQPHLQVDLQLLDELLLVELCHLEGRPGGPEAVDGGEVHDEPRGVRALLLHPAHRLCHLEGRPGQARVTLLGSSLV